MIKIFESSHYLREKVLPKPLLYKPTLKSTESNDDIRSNLTIASILNKYYKVDIENTEFQEVDPSTVKEEDTLVFIFKTTPFTLRPNRRSKKSFIENFTAYCYAYWRDGKLIDLNSPMNGYSSSLFWSSDREINYVTHSGDILRYPNGARKFSVLCEYCYWCYKLNLKTTTEIQKNREERRAGSVDRVQDEQKTNKFKFDKSGYILDTDKYRKILAQINKEAYLKYFNRALEILKKLQELYIKSNYSLEGEDILDWKQDSDIREFKESLEHALKLFASYYRNHTDTDYFGTPNTTLLVRQVDKIKDLVIKYEKNGIKDIVERLL